MRCISSAGAPCSPTAPDEVVLADSFADAHRLEPGDRLAAIINGKRKALTVVGVAVSPGIRLPDRAGRHVPELKRYGVLWAGRSALAAAYDMQGAFNDVTMTLARGQVQDVIDRADAILGGYGGTGGRSRARTNSPTASSPKS